jgi:hypothetical protein
VLLRVSPERGPFELRTCLGDPSGSKLWIKVVGILTPFILSEAILLLVASFVGLITLPGFLLGLFVAGPPDRTDPSISLFFGYLKKVGLIPPWDF